MQKATMLHVSPLFFSLSLFLLLLLLLLLPFFTSLFQIKISWREIFIEMILNLFICCEFDARSDGRKL